MKDALSPTSIVAFLGIVLYLVILLRRPMQIILLMTTLVMSIVITFGFTRITLGELNTITAILGAILMGFGIDFGIHFIYRFRDEYSHRGDIYESLHQTILHTGLSSLISAVISSASLFVLVLAAFKGFSHFGLIAGAGILIIAVMMYTFLPAAILLLNRAWPGFMKSLVVNYKKIDDADHQNKPYPFASRILLASVLLTVVLAYFATQVEFDYDSRTSVTGDTESLMLQDEIEKRFGRKGLPSVVYTDTLEETKKVYDELSNKDKYPHVDRVVSIFSLAPPMEQQLRTREILDRIQERLAEIPADLVTGEKRELFDVVKKSAAAQPFTLKDVPEDLLKQFRPVPESGEKGYFTVIIPKGSVTDSKLTVEFTRQVGSITLDGKTYYATGHMILMANLAMVVIHDGKISPCPGPCHDPAPRRNGLDARSDASLRLEDQLRKHCCLSGCAWLWHLVRDIYTKPVSGEPLGHVCPASYRGGCCRLLHYHADWLGIAVFLAAQGADVDGFPRGLRDLRGASGGHDGPAFADAGHRR
jgi:hypothetical protein